MQIAKWDDSWMIGIEELDRHHQHLAVLINNTYELLVKGESQQKLDLVLEELIGYSEYHFAAEEKCMREHGYPLLAKHIVQHDQYREQVSLFRRDHRAGDQLAAIGVLTFLKDWLIKHITSSDAEFGKFANGAGTSCEAVS